MVKIDLGCGDSKQKGFVGVDRFAFPNVDFIANLDKPLPLNSNSVDVLFASHSLEHVTDLMTTMREIYRVCKHGAQVCILAPYYEQKLNIANPYHISAFNEHTPRFWTDSPEAGVAVEEYSHPHAEEWGLSRSDHSMPGMDLRLVRMEFFYFPEYRNLSFEVQRLIRKSSWDVCDQIMYHLLVWKEECTSPNETLEHHMAVFQPFEPESIKQRRALESRESNSKCSDETSITDDIDIPPSQLSSLASFSKKLGLVNAQLAELTAEKNTMVIETRLLRKEVKRSHERLRAYKANEIERKDQIAEVFEELAIIRASNSRLIESQQLSIDYYSKIASDFINRSTVLPILNYDNGKNPISSAFSELEYYSSKHVRHFKKMHLVHGFDLRIVPYREYNMQDEVAELQAVCVAIHPLLPYSEGRAGVEIVSSSGEVSAQVTLPLDRIRSDTPSVFIFPAPIIGLKPNWSLRIFVKDAITPVIIHELMKYSFFKPHIRFFPFVAIQ